MSPDREDRSGPRRSARLHLTLGPAKALGLALLPAAAAAANADHALRAILAAWTAPADA